MWYCNWETSQESSAKRKWIHKANYLQSKIAFDCAVQRAWGNRSGRRWTHLIEDDLKIRWKWPQSSLEPHEPKTVSLNFFDFATTPNEAATFKAMRDLIIEIDWVNCRVSNQIICAFWHRRRKVKTFLHLTRCQYPFVHVLKLFAVFFSRSTIYFRFKLASAFLFISFGSRSSSSRQIFAIRFPSAPREKSCLWALLIIDINAILFVASTFSCALSN